MDAIEFAHHLRALDLAQRLVVALKRRGDGMPHDALRPLAAALAEAVGAEETTGEAFDGSASIATGSYVDIVFDGPPSISGRFVKIENGLAGIPLGTWVLRDDGCWAMRVPRADPDGEVNDG